MHSFVLFVSIVVLVYMLGATFGHYLPFKTTHEAHEHLINKLHRYTLDHPSFIITSIVAEFIIILGFAKIEWMDIAGVLAAVAICLEISVWMAKDMYVDLS
jgi:hypothetical protein